jgi:hypothetical protein
MYVYIGHVYVNIDNFHTYLKVICVLLLNGAGTYVSEEVIIKLGVEVSKGVSSTGH